MPSVGSHLDFHRPLNAADLTPEQIADVTLRSRSFKSKDEAVRSIEAYFATTGHRVVRKSGGGIYHRYACTNHAAKNGNCPAHIAVRQEGQGEAAKLYGFRMRRQDVRAEVCFLDAALYTLRHSNTLRIALHNMAMSTVRLKVRERR